MALRTKSLTLHISLPISTMSHKALTDLGDNIAKLAPASPLYVQNVALQAAVTGLTQDIADLKQADGDCVKAEADVELCRRTRDNTRTKCEKGVTQVRQFVEHNAATVEDAATLGFSARIGGVPPAPIEPPTSLNVKLGKKHGEFHVTAVSKLRGKWDLEISPDPITATSWTGVPGSAKGRLVTGRTSGSLVWVRMRLVRARGVSDWCAPVPVTVP